MKQKERLTIQVPRKKQLYAMLRKQLGAEQADSLRRIVNRFVRENEKHFKTDGWDLNWNFIKDDIIVTYLGADIDWYLMAAFLEKDMSLEFLDKGLMLRKGKRKQHD
jgi:hypothetical protein